MEVVKAMKECDFKDRFEDIYQHNVDRVFCYILRIVKHRPTAEDLTAEVFYSLWKRKSVLLEYNNITGLLYKISRDISINHLKALARNQKKKKEFLQLFFGLTYTTDEHLLREYQLSTLEQAIDQLPEKCREVVKMKFLLGRSLKEIASELQISVNTVQNHLARGKSMIRELMNTDEAFIILALLVPGLI